MIVRSIRWRCTRRSGGNPFFVAEVLRHEQGDGSLLPATVRDAILGQAALLSGPARDALDAAAVLGNRVGVELIEIVGDCDSAAVDECFASGLLTGDGTTQAFRHDLGRQAVEDAMMPLRRRQLHARALEALAGDADIVQRAHHACRRRRTARPSWSWPRARPTSASHSVRTRKLQPSIDARSTTPTTSRWNFVTRLLEARCAPASESSNCAKRSQQARSCTRCSPSPATKLR